MSATSSFQSTNNSTTQSKRLVFKNLKASPKLPENFESVTWKRLQAAVRAIHLNLGTSDSLEELYKAVEDLCSHKMGANLYRNLQSECAEHIQLVIQKRLLESQSSSAFIYLGLLYNQWNEHCSHMRLIHSIFLFLDRTFVIQNVEVRPIWEMGLELFRNNIIEHPDIRRKTISDLLKLIEQERNGETVDKMLLKNLIHMLVSLQVYSKFFENLFLETTQTFYRNKSQLLMKELELSEYLKHTENCLQEENERVLQYLASSTKAALIATVEKQLLEVHIDGLLSKGFRSLMEESKSDDLRRLYLLFARVNGATEILRKAFGLFVKTRGSILVSDVQREPTLVQDLLDFKAKMDFLLENSFFKLTTFLNALREAFESFINLRSGKVAELLAKFVGSKMSCANKSSSEEDLEQLLDRVMILFRFVHGKDTFEAFYKNDLSKRLLLGRYNVDLEKSMISRLKTECGSSFSHKLEGMFKDFELSKDIMISFKESNYYREKLSDIDLNVHVLTNGYWPAFSSVEINLPKQLSNYLEIFKAFYLQKYSGRKLMWRNTLDHCLVKYQTQSLKKELHISLFQTTVLLLFNEHDRISFKDMEQITGIDRRIEIGIAITIQWHY